MDEKTVIEQLADMAEKVDQATAELATVKAENNQLSEQKAGAEQINADLIAERDLLKISLAEHAEEVNGLRVQLAAAEDKAETLRAVANLEQYADVSEGTDPVDEPTVSETKSHWTTYFELTDPQERTAYYREHADALRQERKQKRTN